MNGAPPTTARPTPALRNLVEVAVILLVFGAVLVASEALGSGTPLGATVGWLGVMAATAAVWWLQRRRGGSLADFGLARPRSWRRTLLLAVAATAFVLVIGGLVLQLLIAGLGLEAPDWSRFREILSTPLGLVLGLFAVWTAAAFGEEIAMRGFVMGRLAAVLGGGRGAWIASLLLSSALFGLLHAYQGVSGILITGVAGLLLGTVYLVVGRNLWVVVLAHGLVDTLSFISLYLTIRSGA